VLAVGVALTLSSVGLGIAGAQSPGQAGGDLLITVEPFRILDTRSGLGQTAPGPISAGQTVSFRVAGVGPVPANATAVVINLTATEATAATFVTAWPDGRDRPDTSVLNVTAGEDVANMITADLSGGRLALYNSVGTVHLVADVAGYLLPPRVDAISFEGSTVAGTSSFIPTSDRLAMFLVCDASGTHASLSLRAGGPQPKYAPISYAGTLTVDGGASPDSIEIVSEVNVQAASLVADGEMHFSGIIREFLGVALSAEVHVTVGATCTVWGVLTPALPRD
jgi:hypothetical protein